MPSTNYLAITKTARPISGEWVINTSLRLPTTVLPPLREGDSEDSRPHVYLKNKLGPITASVELARGSGRAHIILKTFCGPISLKLEVSLVRSVYQTRDTHHTNQNSPEELRRKVFHSMHIRSRSSTRLHSS